MDTDNEYGAMVLGQDLNERFRWIGATDLVKTPEEALAALHQRLIEIGSHLDQLRVQGDETGKPIDFFSPLSWKERLSVDFLQVSSSEGFSAARGIISAMMRWNEDIDGNFVEQFQTTGFDARLWELYLFAALTEAGYSIERPSPAPDFLARGPHGEFALEATTINPSVGPDEKAFASQRPSNESEIAAYVQNYLPIRYAGPLTAKLRKAYWTKPAAAGKPLVFAIQDFHDTMSMTYSGTALPTYLYGTTQEAHRDLTGLLTVTPRHITEHKWGQKTVPSGFFSLPGSEHVSAVIFNSSATISKIQPNGRGRWFWI